MLILLCFCALDEPETWRNSFQRRFDNQWKYLGDGCSCSRETWTHLDNASFCTVSYRKFDLKELTVLCYLIRPHLAGHAIKWGSIHNGRRPTQSWARNVRPFTRQTFLHSHQRGVYIGSLSSIAFLLLGRGSQTIIDTRWGDGEGGGTVIVFW